MTTDGIEVLTLHERPGPNGACLIGFFGSIAVTVTKDDTKPKTWRLSLHDLARAHSRDDGAQQPRAISAAADHDGWYRDNLDDSIPDDWTAEQQDEEAC
jgi:hypothetical protein